MRSMTKLEMEYIENQHKFGDSGEEMEMAKKIPTKEEYEAALHYQELQFERQLGDLPPESEDRVFRPSHYTKYTMEPITFLILNNIPYAEGNVIKYVLRWRDKNGIEDLRKAMRYLEMMIEFEENKEKYLPEITCL